MWLVVVLFIGGMIYVTLNSSKDVEKIKNKKISLYKNMGYEYINNNFQVKYKGGIKDISVNSYVSVDLLKEGVSFGEGEKIVLFKNIKDLSLENETQIQQQISLGKMLVFGGLAFAMERKNKEINNEYIVLSVEDNKGKYNILLQSTDQKDNQSNYNKLRELKEYTN
ncbi:hypothetical protein DVV91_12095 [Clostridium botulinum]|uniref:hypothetical protein n=1 Tax=Clostridium botulinum TaxID=1491 RepID=UPI0019675811|nr:hypothetical protein [Clostridium botulinum]MBN1075082.1 hypothetical protein [Clostridium botulinum]